MNPYFIDRTLLIFSLTKDMDFYGLYTERVGPFREVEQILVSVTNVNHNKTGMYVSENPE